MRKSDLGVTSKRGLPAGSTGVGHGVSQTPRTGCRARFLRVTSLVLLNRTNHFSGSRATRRKAGQRPALWGASLSRRWAEPCTAPPGSVQLLPLTPRINPLSPPFAVSQDYRHHAPPDPIPGDAGRCSQLMKPAWCTASEQSVSKSDFSCSKSAKLQAGAAGMSGLDRFQLVGIIAKPRTGLQDGCFIMPFP